MKKLITLCLALCFAGASHAQWKRIRGNGNVVTIERSVGDYDAIALAGWFDLELISGSEGEITLEGESNLLDYIKTEVKGGKLVIKTQKGVNLKPSSWKSGILVVVPVESVNEVSLSGSGDITSRTTLKSDTFETRISGSGDIVLDVEANSVEASMSGSGDMKLNGSAMDLDVQVSGSGDINAYGLKADNVKVSVSGSADVEVTANESISARVSGSGDISYRGNPKKIDTKSSGSGDISSY